MGSSAMIPASTIKPRQLVCGHSFLPKNDSTLPNDRVEDQSLIEELANANSQN